MMQDIFKLNISTGLSDEKEVHIELEFNPYLECVVMASVLKAEDFGKEGAAAEFAIDKRTAELIVSFLKTSYKL